MPGIRFGRLDGDTDCPTLCGTGSEDYVGTCWGQGAYTDLYQGCTIADSKNMQFAFYRFHAPDPICLFERSDDWSSCCYFHLDKPESGPLLADRASRVADLKQSGEPERREDA